MKKIMSINAGSSSLKFQLINMPEEEVITKGVIERIGLKGAVFNMKIDGNKIKEELVINNHSDAVKILLNKLKEYT
jgi:acetate kinase